MNPITYASRVLLLSLPLSSLAFASNPMLVKPTVSSLNVRSYKGEKLCVVSKDSKLTMLEPVVGSWMKVKIEAASGCPNEGYVSAKLMERATEAAPTPAAHWPKVENPQAEPVKPEVATPLPPPRPNFDPPLPPKRPNFDPPAPPRRPASEPVRSRVTEHTPAPEAPKPRTTPGQVTEVSVEELEEEMAQNPEPAPKAPAPPPAVAPMAPPNPLRAAPANEVESAKRRVRVTARGLNVRTSDGEILCAIPRNTSLTALGRHGDGERIKVALNQRGCPKEGYVSSTYIRPVEAGVLAAESVVEADALSLRSRPDLGDNSWKCALPKNTKLSVQPENSKFQDEVSWVKVKLTHAIRGCPTEGYVAEPYLRTSDHFTDLPVVKGTEDCESGGCVGNGGPRTGDALSNIGRLGRGLGNVIRDDKGKSGPFVDGLRAMMKNRQAKPRGLATSRGLVQIPLKGNRGPCGSFHYLPDKPLGVDAYANPLTACVMTSLLQDWKKNFCPSHQAGCRIAWGDISHKTSPLFNTHRTHTDGYCIDIRPMAKGSFGDRPLTYRSGNYDRAKMRQFVQLLRAKGGSNIYFNDRSLGTRAVAGHDNHIHVCFKDNPTTQNVCKNLKVDPEVCPELQ